MNLEQIALACVAECRRQGVGLDRLAFLLCGYNYAFENAARLPSEDDVLHLAGVVEPTTMGRYRTTAVIFRHGGSSASAAIVPGAMAHLFNLLERSTDAREFVHHFLAIHPFADGNGRLGFLLYNWLARQLNDPLPLPEYDFNL